MDAHEREYLAAADGVAGNPEPRHGHAVGDQIWFRRPDMPYPASGRVVELVPLGCYRVQTESGETLIVWAEEITVQ